MDFLQRTKLLLTDEQIEKLTNANIIVFGCGGVGGYAVEMLVRSGITNLTVVDFDVIDITNINRQIIATSKTIGKPKVEVIKLRAEEINPEIKITAINKRLSEDTINEFKLENFDFVIDAIDSVTDKVLLIKTCYDKGIHIISSMGAGNKFEMPDFKVMDIYQTEHDGLAKKMRKLLKEAGIKKLDVISSNQKAVSMVPIGSISYYPAVAGCMVGAYVINKIIKK